MEQRHRFCICRQIFFEVLDNSEGRRKFLISSQQRFVVDGQCVAGGGMHGGYEV